MVKRRSSVKFVLSISLMGFLSLGTFLEGGIIAEENSTVQTLPDGTKLIQGKDGTTIQVKPDGSKIIKKANGASIEVKTDGTKIISEPN